MISSQYERKGLQMNEETLRLIWDKAYNIGMAYSILLAIDSELMDEELEIDRKVLHDRIRSVREWLKY
jgi:hypothetical protein